ncbi:MAG: FtsX-like permease family protein [Deltaproteobacteria bacterium]|nr:FtsX-like permease family protein [Deltaproteobacteria bacterium]
MRVIEKHRNILDFTLSSLARRKGKNLSLVFVYTFVVFLIASVTFFTHSLKTEAEVILRDAPEMMVQRLVAGRHDLIPMSYMDTIRQIRGVQSVTSRLWGYYFDPTNGANYTLLVKPEEHSTSGTILVGRGVARSVRSKQTGTIPFKTYDGSYLFLRIKEVFTAESELANADLILISEADFKRLFAYPDGYATDLVLHVRNANELPTIATKITHLLPDTRPILREEIVRTYDAVFSWRGGLVIVVLLGVVLAFFILAWEKATGLSAEERREIGILKGLGWETTDVLFMKFWEGAVISLSAFFLGILCAYGHVFFTSSMLFEPALKGWSVIYPDFRLTPVISAYQISTLFFLTVLPYTVATIVPAWRAATVDPDTVMRA